MLTLVTMFSYNGLMASACHLLCQMRTNICKCCENGYDSKSTVVLQIAPSVHSFPEFCRRILDISGHVALKVLKFYILHTVY